MLLNNEWIKNFIKEKIISSIFYEHKGLKLETKLKEKIYRPSNSYRLNNMCLKNESVNNEIKGKI